VDPGETFQEAAIREAKEEAGIGIYLKFLNFIDIELKGVLSFEYFPKNTHVQQRMIFYAVPKDLNQNLKTEPDYESQSAIWISYSDFTKKLNNKEIELRGKEPIKWFKYLNEGGSVYPLSLLSN
jgi:8-oxo-dGTP pyrophosphatase MutT (NUDIX family)